jgi:surface protein
VTISGVIEGWDFLNYATSYRTNIKEVLSWGPLRGQNNSNANMFFFCFNLQLSGVTDIPNLSGITATTSMFNACNSTLTINNINSWDVSSVKVMTGMFAQSTINSDISNWDVSNVTDMSFMFSSNGNFNQDINNWNVSGVTDMTNMFLNSYSFNQPLSGWNVSNVVYMSNMFDNASSFDQDITNWDISSVTNVDSMFNGASSFNQDLSSWNVSGITTMYNMFNGASLFNQDLSSWDVSNVLIFSGMLDYCGVSQTNYDNLLVGWSGLTLQNGITFGAETLLYSPSPCPGGIARTNIINNYSWTFIGDSAGSCP